MSIVCWAGPCCGCCGTGVWGRNDPPMDEEPDFDYDGDFSRDHDYEEVDPEDCDHGDYSWTACGVHCDICETEGVVIHIMGEALFRPV